MKVVGTITIITMMVVWGVYILLNTQTNRTDSVVVSETKVEEEIVTNTVNTPEDTQMNSERMLLVLAAPDAEDPYYEEYFEGIVDFQIEYANKVYDLGNDDIRIFVNERAATYFEGKVPKEILIEEEMHDIWMRDFTTINPYAPVQFIFTNASMSWEESEITQERFDEVTSSYGVDMTYTDYVLDGGNIVDNYRDKVITTTRFLEDNDLEYEEGKKVLKELLGATHVAILEPDDDVLAHSDGMVSWIEDDVLLANDYSEVDPELHTLVQDELRNSFPGTTIVTVPVAFDMVDDKAQAGGTGGIGSACGINLNLVSTESTLYVPIFGNSYESEVLDIIKKHSSKDIVTIDARSICELGGSARCTVWQLAGRNVTQFLKAVE